MTNSHSARLLDRIRTRTARVGVVGLGSVGLPLARAFAEAGFEVLGFERDAAKLARIQRGEDVLLHLGLGFTRKLLDGGRFTPTGDFEREAELDVALISGPSPLGPANDPDLADVAAAAEMLARQLRPGALVVLESTTYPGTTRGVIGPILERAGRGLGVDVFLAYSPERENPGPDGPPTRSIDKLVGGTCAASGELAHALYAQAIERVHRVERAEVAEAAKLFENVFRAVNIALVNELKVVLEPMGLDAWDVIDAAATKPFGFMRFTPGPGMGGHCIPIDPWYLAWVARRHGARAEFVELAGEVNRRIPRWVVDRCESALRARGRELRGARVLVLGLAFKPDVDIVTESPSLRLLAELHARGAVTAWSDPHVAVAPPCAGAELANTRSVPLDAATLANFDLVLVSTDHTAFDWDLVARHARLVVDTRNALGTRMAGSTNYVRA
ncbi:MAG: nucleotide sugar dehydrogenase [Planctomycetes bacterium]|nr:nucleotide sugar dehydrogenase [Planctomycetota bacterium]